MIVSVVLVGLEIAKIIINYNIGNIPGTLPFHFCSMYIIWFPLSVFTKGKFKHALQCMSVIGSSYMTLLLYIFPTRIIGYSELAVFKDFLGFHNFVVHQLFIFYMLFNKIYVPKKYDFIYMMIGITFYACIGVPGALLTNYNYANLLYTNIPFLDNLIKNFGYGLYISLYYVFGLLLAFVSTYGYYLIFNAIAKRKKQTETRDTSEVLQTVNNTPIDEENIKEM